MSFITPPSSTRSSLDSSSPVHQLDASPCPPSSPLPSHCLSVDPSPPVRHPADSSSPVRHPTEALPTPRPSLELTSNLVKQIQGFLSGTPNDNPTGRFEIKGVPEDEYVATGRLIGESHQQFWYNTASKSIIVKAPPSQMQNGCLRILHLIKNAVNKATQQGGFACRVRGGPIGMLDIYDHTDRLSISGKEADGCLDVSIKGVEPPRLPYLILEAGYSESYSDLMKDARDWLTDYDKEVLAVVLVKVSRRSEVPISYDLSDWNGSAEVWERDPTGQGIQRFGNRVTFLPAVGAPPTLSLRLDHTIPRHLLPDNLKDTVLSVALDEAVEECGRALDWMRVCSLKRKRSEASKEERNRRQQQARRS